jgi:hypothetical protein
MGMEPAPQREDAPFQAVAQLTGAFHGEPALRQRIECCLPPTTPKTRFLPNRRLSRSAEPPRSSSNSGQEDYPIDFNQLLGEVTEQAVAYAVCLNPPTEDAR